jgi:hypothetical protein
MDTNAVSDGALPGLLAPATNQIFRDIPSFKRVHEKIRAALRAITRALLRNGGPPYGRESIRASEPKA